MIDRQGADCAEIRAELEAYIGGELDPAAGARVARHLEQCGSCTAEHDELAALVADLRHAGHSVRPLHTVSALELQLAGRRRHRWLTVAAAVAAVWAVAMTVLVFVPSASERFGLAASGEALQEARREAATARARSARLQVANLRLQDRLTAARLGIPVAAARALGDYLRSISAAAGVQDSWVLADWSLARIERPHDPDDSSPFTPAVKYRIRARQKTVDAEMEILVEVYRSSDGTWQAQTERDR